MQEKEETVRNHCIHKDCVYRSYIDGGATPICYYAVLEGRSRGCKISECDKYKGGKPIKAKMGVEYILFWEYELNDVDAIWKRR